MSKYQKPTLESFGSFRDVTRFGFLSYFFGSYTRRWSTTWTYQTSNNYTQPSAS